MRAFVLFPCCTIFNFEIKASLVAEMRIVISRFPGYLFDLYLFQGN